MEHEKGPSVFGGPATWSEAAEEKPSGTHAVGESGREKHPGQVSEQLGRAGAVVSHAAAGPREGSAGKTPKVARTRGRSSWAMAWYDGSSVTEAAASRARLSPTRTGVSSTKVRSGAMSERQSQIAKLRGWVWKAGKNSGEAADPCGRTGGGRRGG